MIFFYLISRFSPHAHLFHNSIYLMHYLTRMHYFSIILCYLNILHLFFLCAVPPSKSNYWKYFIRINESGKCNICQQIIKTSGNTTNLRFHLMRTHLKIHLQMKNSRADTNVTSTESSPLTKQRKLMVRNIITFFIVQNV